MHSGYIVELNKLESSTIQAKAAREVLSDRDNALIHGRIRKNRFMKQFLVFAAAAICTGILYGYHTSILSPPDLTMIAFYILGLIAAIFLVLKVLPSSKDLIRDMQGKVKEVYTAPVVSVKEDPSSDTTEHIVELTGFSSVIHAYAENLPLPGDMYRIERLPVSGLVIRIIKV